MKKILFVFAALVMLATSASAQFSNGGKKSSSRSDSSNGAVGVNVLYGTEVGSVGFGAKFQVNIIQALRAEGEFDYFLKKDYVFGMECKCKLSLSIHRCQRLKGISSCRCNVYACDF